MSCSSDMDENPCGKLRTKLITSINAPNDVFSALVFTWHRVVLLLYQIIGWTK